MHGQLTEFTGARPFHLFVFLRELHIDVNGTHLLEPMLHHFENKLKEASVVLGKCDEQVLDKSLCDGRLLTSGYPILECKSK